MDGSPQVIIASAKAYDGRKVPLYGTGSLTELGTNNEATRERAEKELMKGIERERIGADYTREDQRVLLEQVRQGRIFNGAAYGVPSVYLGADRKRHP